jgi:hypothetical protein
MGNITREFLKSFERGPDWVGVRNIRELGAMSLSEMFPSGAVEKGVLEGFVIFFACGAEVALVALVVGGLGRKVTNTRPHLVESGGLELSKSHESVGFFRDGELIGRVWVEVGPFLAEAGGEKFVGL